MAKPVKDLGGTMKNSGLGPLLDGGTAVVIGGGPAGAATAIALQQGARDLGRKLRVVVVEGKQFAGEQHHNQCVGVLSPPVMELIQGRLGVPFPCHLIRGSITGYVLHTPHRQIVLDGQAEPSIALRRVQFDAYMLDAIREREIEILHARVTALEFHADRVVIYSESGSLETDVVVGAFGLDEGTAVIFGRAVGYRSPPALSSVVTKYHPGPAGMKEFGGRIHAFLPATPHIEFGAVTPKGNHLTINIAGAAVDADLMATFLAFPEVRRALPCPENAGRFNADLRYFKGYFPRGLARNFTGDRFVMVGDAAGLVRAFKGKGVTSAILTGIRAADVILRQGISATAFQAYHAANRDITGDLPYGQLMRHLTILAARFNLLDPVLQAAELDPGLRQALFDAVSAHRSYREVIHEGFSLASIRTVAKALARTARPQ
jgi:flavin-dependent dehydrogenase